MAGGGQVPVWSSLRVGSRTSALARWQTERVRSLLMQGGTASVFVGVRTVGDVHTGSLAGAGGDGLFVSALEDALVRREIDLAVHSLKDMPVVGPAGLEIAAVLARHDARDAVVGGRLDALAPGARVGTSSPRRAAFVAHRRPDVEIVAVRGNVPRRLALLDEGAVDALVLAVAGLERLGLGDRIAERLPLDGFPPAPGQGAIAVQGRYGESGSALRALDDRATRLASEAERLLLARLGGGCDLPLGAYATVAADGQVHLLARLVRADATMAAADVVAPTAAAAAQAAAALLGVG